MAKRRIDMHEYRQIIVQLRLGVSIRAVAKAGLASRSKVKQIHLVATAQGWLDVCKDLPGNEVLASFFTPASTALTTKPSVLPYAVQIEEWCEQGVQCSVIHAVLQRQHGFQGSYDAVQRFVKKLKSNKLPVATMVLDFKPGEAAQVDFGSGPVLTDPFTGEIIKTWFFVMVLAWSRHMYAEIVLHQDVETWLGCHRRAFEWFGGVPAKIIIDNPKCAITRACYYDPVVQRAYSEYAEAYGFIISACPPRDPKKKGRVESGVKYVKRNFLPLRNIASLVDGNQQLISWLLGTAGNRIHGTTHKQPLALFETERLLLKPLPERPPECAVWEKARLHGDCHLQYLKCRYSAPYKLVRQLLWVCATETTVKIFQDHTLVTIHPRRFRPGERSTLIEHLPPNAIAYCMQDSQWCLKNAKTIGNHCEQVIQTLLNDSVVDYLRAAQGIVGLGKKYGSTRLDAACQRALAFQSVHYKTIKSILQQGLEYSPLPDQEAFDALTETYTGGGHFCRDTSTLLQ